MSDVAVQGMVISQGVLETIIRMAVEEIPGVENVGIPGVTGGIKSLLATKQEVPGIEVRVNDADELEVDVHVEVLAGLVLPNLAATIRSTIADALLTQTGIKVALVDVYVDGLRFEK